MKIKHLLSLLILFISLTSCQFNETIKIEKDGSGEMTLGVDASQMMAMMSGQAEDKQEKIDTIINFKTFIEEHKDSISKLSQEEQKTLKNLENFTMHMVMDSEKNQMFFNLTTTFENVEELTDVLKQFNAAKELGNDNSLSESMKPMGGMLKSTENVEVSYTHDKKKFTRFAKIIDKEKFEKMKDSIANEISMFAASSYVLKYEFAKKIKSVSNDAAVISPDKKTVTLSFTFGDYVLNPEKMNVEIKF